MRTFAGRRAASGLALGVALAFLATTESAYSFTVEEPASVLIFPKVVCEDGDPQRETVIQTTNNDNVMSHAQCFYTDGQTVNGLPRWNVTDFRLTLTRQQTTTWSACTGRPVDARDSQNGLDPGFVPPVVPGFTGSLVCVQTDITGSPNGGEDLTGRADVGGAGYNAVGIRTGTNGDDGDNILDLDGLEYQRCPTSYHLNFATAGSAGAIALSGLSDVPATVSTSMTVVPCSFDFANLIPARVTIGYDPIVDEMEAAGSQGAGEVICWDNLQLEGIGFDSVLTSFGTAQVNGTDSDGAAVPFAAVANVFRVGGTSQATDSASTNLHANRTAPLASARIVLP